MPSEVSSGLTRRVSAGVRPAGKSFVRRLPAWLKDLVARMGHDSERAALMYQHEARGARQRITDAIDFHVQAERGIAEDDDGTAGLLVPVG